MNYLSGGKKSILGTRLSSRYLSSDAFTSSAGKTGGRSISRLGSLFSRKTSTKRLYGTGQRMGLFEFKNIFLKGIFVLVCIIVLGYTIPFFRYSVHSFFARSFDAPMYDEGVDTQTNTLGIFEYYISPVFGRTDRFVINTREVTIPEGSLVYSTNKEKNIVGVYLQASSSKPQVVLLSEVGQRNNFFIKEISTPIPVQLSETATTSEGESEDDAVVSSSSVETEKPVIGFTTVLFEGFGYGQLRAQVPPQEEIALDTILYMRTENGLVPAARVSYLEKDAGSTFTNIYAQLLVAPFQLYKVHIDDVQ